MKSVALWVIPLILHLLGQNISGATAGSGIKVTGGDPTIVENTITGNKYGIYVSDGTPKIGTSSTSSDNTINGSNTHGIYVSGSGAAPVVRNNWINSNTYGVTKKSSGSPDLGTSIDSGNNNLSGNSTYCIWNQTSTGITADGNYFGTCDGGGNPPVCWSGLIFYTTNLCTTPASGVNVAIEAVPEARALMVRGAWPNPTVASSAIRFELGQLKSEVTINVYDVAGRLVRSLGGGDYSAGPQEVIWDGLGGNGETVPDGLYFVRLTVNNKLQQTVTIVVSR